MEASTNSSKAFKDQKHKNANHKIIEVLKVVLGQILPSLLSRNWPKPLIFSLMAKIYTLKTFIKRVSCG